jgi:hypothetical protein
MNRPWQTITDHAFHPPVWRRGLALVCCFLAVLISGPAALTAPTLTPQALLAGDAGGRGQPIEEDEDGKHLDEQAGAARSLSERAGRDRRVSRSPRTSAWLAHLPHHHAGQPGYSLPTCSPFARGSICLPLRC